MLVALDYDDTYTRDPDLWIMVIMLMQKRGHRVIVCTMRTPSEALLIDQKLVHFAEKVYATSRQAKAEFLSQEGVLPDIWIDDNPRWLYIHAAGYEKKDVDPLREVGLTGADDETTSL